MPNSTQMPLPVGGVGFGPALYALRIQRVLAYVGLLFSALLLVFVVAGRSAVLPTSHALNGSQILTAVSLLLLSLTLMGGSLFKKPTWPYRTLLALVICLPVARIFEVLVLNGTPISNAAEAAFGVPHDPNVEMGLNTAVSLFLIGLGAAVRRRSSSTAFVFCMGGLVVPSISALGYSYQHPGLHGAMSIETTALLVLLGLSETLVLVRSPLLRPFLTTSSWGRMARLQMLGLLSGTWIIGLVLQKIQIRMHLEYVIAAMIWLFLITMLVTGPLFERVDRDRRALERNLKRWANIDPLTGLWNRHAVRDMERSGRYGAQKVHPTTQGMGVILADIDFFKRVNDASGHDVGDAVLRNVAQVLRKRVRSTDVVARWGGEEFLILLPEASLCDALKIAQVLRVAVATSVSWTHEGQSTPMTLSMGVAALSPDADTGLGAAIQQADTALLKAKSGGRNRVKFHGQKPPCTNAETLDQMISNRSVH